MNYSYHFLILLLLARGKYYLWSASIMIQLLLNYQKIERVKFFFMLHSNIFFLKMKILFLIFVIEGCTLEWAGVKLHRPIHGNMSLQIYGHDRSWMVTAIYLPYYILKSWNYILLYLTLIFYNRLLNLVQDNL